jgi:hypothetical protein
MYAVAQARDAISQPLWRLRSALGGLLLAQPPDRPTAEPDLISNPAHAHALLSQSLPGTDPHSSAVL